MKLLIFLDNTYVGGSERSIFPLLNGLRYRNSLDIMLAYRKNTRLDRQLKSAAWHHVILHPLRLGWFGGFRLEQKPESNWLSVVKTAIGAIPSFLSYTLVLSRDQVRLRSLIYFERPDVVHVVMGGFPGARSSRLLLGAAGRFPEIKLVLSVHNQPSTPSVFWRLVENRITLRALRAANAITVGSEATRLAFQAAYPSFREKFLIVPNSNPDEETAAKSAHDSSRETTFDVVCVANLEERKGLEVLLEAVSHILDNPQTYGLGSVRACIVGDGAEYDRLVHKAKNAGLEGAFNFVGFQDDYVHYIRRAAVYVQPSLFNEDSPLAAICALQLGKPLIVARVGGLPELVRHGFNGFVFEPGDVVALANALATLLSDQRALQEFGDRSREQYLAQHSNDAFVARLQRIYGLASPQE